MSNVIKSALDKIKAEEELVSKTEKVLKEASHEKKYSYQMKNKGIGVFTMKKITIAACLVLIIGGVSLWSYKYYNDKTPVAYLSLDINPSIELGVNSSNEVVSATSYNDDGATVLENVDVVNMDVKDAVNELVTSASDNGFIADDGSTIISVTSETDDASLAEELTNEAEDGAQEAINETEDTAVVYKDNVALSRRDEARELGITPGKLNLIQKILALDPTATIEDYKDAKVTNIMKRVVELKKDKKNNVSETGDSEIVNDEDSTVVPDKIEATVAKAEENSNKKSNLDSTEGKDETKSGEVVESTEVNEVKPQKQNDNKTYNEDKGKEKNKQGKGNVDAVSPEEVQNNNEVLGVDEVKEQETTVSEEHNKKDDSKANSNNKGREDKGGSNGKTDERPGNAKKK